MTQTDISPVSDAPEGIKAPAPHHHAARRYGLLIVLAVAVLVVSSALGSVVNSRKGPSLEATVVGRCRAVNVAAISHHAGNDFTSIVIGQGKPTRHPDGSWTVVEQGHLSGHIKDGVRDGDQVTITKTCDFSRTAAQNRTAPAEQLNVHFDGTRANFYQEFALDSKGTSYSFVGGEGLQGP